MDDFYNTFVVFLFLVTIYFFSSKRHLCSAEKVCNNIRMKAGSHQEWRLWRYNCISFYTNT